MIAVSWRRHNAAGLTTVMVRRSSIKPAWSGQSGQSRQAIQALPLMQNGQVTTGRIRPHGPQCRWSPALMPPQLMGRSPSQSDIKHMAGKIAE